jgi:SAM-dependent methyltransferase
VLEFALLDPGGRNRELRLLSGLMDHVAFYRWWQTPFAGQKLLPVQRHNDLSKARRVLDVACGPGTNTAHFTHAEYLGLDINPAYIAWARRRYGDRFAVADVRHQLASPGAGFDFILVNSFFHHVATPDAHQILSHLSTLLTEDGHVHILDLVMPRGPSIARFLARSDRGEFPRPLGEWRSLFSEHFAQVVFEPYPLGALGMTLWHMVYFKGKRKA